MNTIEDFIENKRILEISIERLVLSFMEKYPFIDAPKISFSTITSAGKKVILRTNVEINL